MFCNLVFSHEVQRRHNKIPVGATRLRGLVPTTFWLWGSDRHHGVGQGRSQTFVLGRYKTLIFVFNYRLTSFLHHEKFA